MFNKRHKNNATRHKWRVDGFKTGVLLVVLSLILMSIRTGYEYIDFSNSQSNTPKKQENSIQVAKSKNGVLNSSKQPSIDMPVHSFNPRTGELSAPTQIIVFANLNCNSCHETIRALKDITIRNPSKLNMTIKFMLNKNGKNIADPDINSIIQTGLFSALAHEKGIYWQFADNAYKNNAVTASDYVSILEGLKVPLRETRNLIADGSERYIKQMEQDMEDFEILQTKKFPVVIINNTVISSANGISLRELATQEVNRRLRGRY